MRQYEEFIGKKFGKLLVVDFGEDYISPSGKRKHRFICRCECGKESLVDIYSLQNGSVKSCGCQKNTKHGMYNSRLYKIWDSMKCRCSDTPSGDKNYKNIKVCSEWESFEPFMEWALNNGYASDLSIDRIDFLGDYCPKNCRWVTIKAQANNKNNNHLATYNGETHTIAEWADILGANYNTLLARFNKYHWSDEKAIGTPIKRRA